MELGAWNELFGDTFNHYEKWLVPIITGFFSFILPISITKTILEAFLLFVLTFLILTDVFLLFVIIYLQRHYSPIKVVDVYYGLLIESNIVKTPELVVSKNAVAYYEFKLKLSKSIKKKLDNCGRYTLVIQKPNTVDITPRRLIKRLNPKTNLNNKNINLGALEQDYEGNNNVLVFRFDVESKYPDGSLNLDIYLEYDANLEKIESTKYKLEGDKIYCEKLFLGD